MSATSHDLSDSTASRPKDHREASGVRPTCPQCNQTLPADAVAGLCPKCLMGLAMTDTVQALDDLTDPAQVERTTGGLPRQFGRYTILNQLGRGAMGVVHLAKDDELERLVAIKVPLFGRSDEEAVYRRFQREVRAAAGLRHPNICPIYDVGQIDGTIYMSMAYISGRPLSEFIAADKVFSIRQLAQLARKLTSALQEAHRHGIVHRDLKPANIMIDQRGEPLVMDFGLASRNSEDDPCVTRSGAIVGTVAYMSPEQLAGHVSGTAGDIYAMGVVLFELLTGRLPFEGDLVELVAQVARDQPQRPSEFRQDVPPVLDEICLRALAKKPEDRYVSMDEFTQALTQFLTDLAVVAVVAPTSDLLQPDPLQPDQVANIGAVTAVNPWWWHLVAGAGGLALAGSGVLLVCLMFGLGPVDSTPAVVDANAVPMQPTSSDQDQTSLREPALQEPALREPELRATGPMFSADTVAGKNKPSKSARPDALPAHGPLRGPEAVLPGEDLPSEEPLDSKSTALVPQSSAASLASGGPDASAKPQASTKQPADPAAAASRQEATNRVDLAALKTDDAALKAIKPGAAASSPSSDLLGVDGARDKYFQKSLDELRGIAFERRRLIDKTRQAIARHDVELPDLFVKEQGKLAALNRQGNELRADLTNLELEILELNRENTRFDLNPIDRLANTADLKRLRQLQAIQLNKHKSLGVEVAGIERTIAGLRKEQLALASEVKRQVTEASKLLEQAFWVSEPTGTFSAEQYDQISALFADWLRDGVTGVEVQALYAIALGNAEKLPAARTAAGQATARNSQSPLAVAALGYIKSKGGEANEGLRDLSRATRLSRKFAAGHVLRALVNRQLERHDAALQDLQRAVALSPKNLAAMRLLALQLAASPSESQRDPAAALALAKAACKLTDNRDWHSLEVLAVAYGATGEFGQAIQTQHGALKLCPVRELPVQRERLGIYQEGRTFLLK